MNVASLKIPSPIEKVAHPFLVEKGVTLFVKREDQIHPEISGNKWRKLKYNLVEARENQISTLITFGGAFSNHVYAFAAACSILDFEGIVIIRGEADLDNPTTNFALSKGMTLHYVSREAYKAKEESEEIKAIISQYKKHLIIPEGGSNDAAIIGVRELAHEINETDFDAVLVALGTGGTCRGLLKHLDTEKTVLGYSSLKSDYHKNELAQTIAPDRMKRFLYNTDYHFGGYGKTTPSLINFINDFYIQTNIPLDPIYNAKVISGFFDQIEQGKIDDTSKTYLWVHTGGLQGIASYNYMAAKKKKPLIEF